MVSEICVGGSVMCREDGRKDVCVGFAVSRIIYFQLIGWTMENGERREGPDGSWEESGECGDGMDEPILLRRRCGRGRKRRAPKKRPYNCWVGYCGV
jgi:hypothetical protein